jgi:hypothetical protein
MLLLTLPAAGGSDYFVHYSTDWTDAPANVPGSTATRRIVFTGSHNLSHSANYLDDELFVKLEDDTTYAAFRYSWVRMTAGEDVYTDP